MSNKPKKRAETMWMIEHHRDGFIPDWWGYNRKDCLKRFQRDCDCEVWTLPNYRCVKVQIKEL